MQVSDQKAIYPLEIESIISACMSIIKTLVLGVPDSGNYLEIMVLPP
jgi:hypothetical protein